MNLTRKTLPALATLAALGLAAHPVAAQTTLTPANSNIGTPGVISGGTADDNGTFVGNTGGSGYSAYGSNSPSLVVNGPTLAGGAGGETVGTDATANYQGGDGGDGLQVFFNTTATVNSGTFTGGIGGAASGVGNELFGGSGGSGLKALDSTANVFGGTFQGGNGGPATGAGTLSGEFAGFGLNANTDSIVNVYGGSFTGGNAAPVPGGNPGAPGDGLIDLGGVMKVYGGSFTGGTGGFGVDVFDGSTTLYGSSFLVNGVAMASGSLTGMGTITGKLQDNASVSTFSYRVIGGTLNLSGPAPVPEASTTVSLGLLLALGTGGVLAARRRKTTPA